MLYKIAELLCSCCTLTTVQFKKYVNDMKYVTAVAVAVYVRTSYAIVSRHCLKSLPFFFFFFFFSHIYIQLPPHLMHYFQADGPPSRRIIGILPFAYPTHQKFYTP